MSPHARPPAIRASAASARLDALRRANLLFAPPSQQKAFWVHTNRASRRRKPLLLSESIGELMQGGFAPPQRHIPIVHQLMESFVPANVLNEIEIGALHRGMLTMHVHSGAAAYEYQRSFAEMIIQACQEAAPQLKIRRVRFQVASN